MGVPHDPPPESICAYCGKPKVYLAGILMRTVIWIPQSCGCPEELAAKEAEEARKSAEQKERYARKLHDAGILPRYQNSVIDDSEAALFIANFDDNPGTGLYILGVCGSGKTSLACAVAQKLFDAKRKVKVTTAIDMLGDIQETFDNNSSTNSVVADFINYDLLVIDDMGKESAGDWALRTLFRILNARYGEMRSTIITSEYEPADLGRRMSRQGFGDPATAILSRLKETCKKLKRPDIDFRNVPGGYSEYQKTHRTG